MSDIFAKGHKCFYRGQNITGDGEHTRDELWQQIVDAKKKDKPDLEVLNPGVKEYFDGLNIVGDGVHTREQLALKIKAKKVKPKRGAGITKVVTRLDTQTSKSASQKDPEKLPKPKQKKKK